MDSKGCLTVVRSELSKFFVSAFVNLLAMVCEGPVRIDVLFSEFLQTAAVTEVGQ
jgi:hypothetical protein